MKINNIRFDDTRRGRLIFVKKLSEKSHAPSEIPGSDLRDITKNSQLGERNRREKKEREKYEIKNFPAARIPGAETAHGRSPLRINSQEAHGCVILGRARLYLEARPPWEKEPARGPIGTGKEGERARGGRRATLVHCSRKKNSEEFSTSSLSSPLLPSPRASSLLLFLFFRAIVRPVPRSARARSSSWFRSRCSLLSLRLSAGAARGSLCPERRADFAAPQRGYSQDTRHSGLAE